MATDINLNTLTWVEPTQIRNFSDNKSLIKWALQFLTIDGNWLVLRPFSCSKIELKLLTDAVGEIPQLKYDFQSATLIYFHLRNFHRFSADEIEELLSKPKMLTWSRSSAVTSPMPLQTACIKSSPSGQVLAMILGYFSGPKPIGAIKSS